MSNEDAVNQFYAWNGFVYVTPLLGGYIADTHLGRYKTILLFSCLYLIGLSLFVVGSIPGAITVGLVFFAMYTIALGAGGIKPNVSTMGADQFDPQYEQDKKEAAQFFSYFYWSINLGSLIAYSLVAYVCQFGLPFLGGESWGFFIGYLIPTVMMFIGVAVFVSGSGRYKKVRPKGSMLSTAAGIVYEAIITRRSYTSPTGYVLDKASEEHGGSFAPNDVEGVKYVAKLAPFLSVMIPFWGIYGQTKTAFQIQGCQMQVDLGGFELPISAMNMFNNIAILILVPYADQIFYPWLKRKGYNLTMLHKIALGFSFAALAMLISALVEYARMEYAPSPAGYESQNARDNISHCRDIDDFNPYLYQQWYAGTEEDQPASCSQTCSTIDPATGLLDLSCIDCDNIPQMSGISIMWQVPQFVIIGIAEIFASITALEFFYSQAPSRMRSVSQASNLFTNAMGSWLTIPLTLVVNADPNNPWIASNIDEGNLEAYFYLLFGMMVAALLVLLYLSAGYQYADPIALANLDLPSGNDARQGLLAGEEVRKLSGAEDDEVVVEGFSRGK